MTLLFKPRMIVKVLAMAALTTLLMACGQSGALYLPQTLASIL